MLQLSQEIIVEALGAFFGILYVILAIRENPLCWPIGILNAGIYIYVFLQSRLYADSMLQVVYVILSAYGWYQWKYGGSNKTVLPIQRTPYKMWRKIIPTIIGGTFVLGYTLHKYTNADLAFGDSFATVVSLTAQWMTSKKYLENWILWAFINSFYLFLYAKKGLWITLGLYFIFLLLAIKGYKEWKKRLSW